MTKRDYKLYLQDILENMEMAEKFLKGCTFDKFSKDKKTVYAVIRSLEIIGEASKHIPVVIRNRYPDVPWRQMAGMRDVLVHEYFGIVIKVVWRAVKEEIPKAKPQLAKIVKELL
ncbi:MAG: DUF86 domain-containing protein [bacterium]|nr:DUF86 domain-containing protein [bacterium]MDD5756243.1 DUF86 domain-containing protein [bacterium]